MAQRTSQPQDDRSLQRFNRTFSAFCLENNIHCVPVDEQEEERLDDFNRLLRELFGGQMIFPPFPPETQGREPDVLDCGFGKGAWIDDLLQEHDANVSLLKVFDLLSRGGVTGIDVYLGMIEGDEPNKERQDDVVEEYFKKRWNLNARFSEDRSADRLRPDSFDLIHSRCLSEGIKAARWPSYVRDLKHLLRPGGWLQMCEADLVFQSSAGRSMDNTFLLRWRQWYSDAMARMGLNPRVGGTLKSLMEEAGFEHVQIQTFQLPIGAWDPNRLSLGRVGLDNASRMLNSVSMWPMLMVSRMPPEQYRNLILGAQQELEKKEHKWYISVYVAWGRRSRRER